MKICLKAEPYLKLLDYVLQGSPEYSPLDQAVKIDGGTNTSDEYWVDCSEQQADLYLQTAQNHFSTFVRDIGYAIRTSRR